MQKAERSVYDLGYSDLGWIGLNVQKRKK